MEKIKQLEREMMRLDLPDFAPGETVREHVKIKEGEKERIQVFQGVVISKRKGMASASFTVRKGILRRGRRTDFSAALARHRKAR